MAENLPVDNSSSSSNLVPQQKYSGNDYDVYALVAGTLGGSTLLLCMSYNLALYCLPILPLVLGIITLRNAHLSVDPKRSRNLAWLGIIGGGLGTLFTLALIAFFILYFVFVFTVFVNMIPPSPRR